MTTSNKSIHLSWLALLVFAGAGLFGYLMKAIDGFHATPGDLIDARFNSVILEHLYHWLRIGVSGHWTDVWSPAFFYPYQNVLAFSDNHFGSVVFYGLFRYFGVSREYAFDAWFVIGALLNFLASFWALRQWRFGLIASALGAFVFSASLPVLMADNAAQLNYRFAIPFAWFFLYQALISSANQMRWLYFGISCLFVAEQFLCSIYLGVLLVYSLAAMVIAWWWVFRNKTIENKKPFLDQFKVSRDQQHLALFGITLILVAGLMIGSLLFQYHQIAREYGLARDNAEVISMLPKVGSYLLSDRSFTSGMWSTNLGWFAQRQENQLFIGLGVMLFLLAGIYRCYRSSVAPIANVQLGKVAFISLALVWLMTLQVSGYSLYSALLQLPGVNAIRSVGRVILVLLFPIALLVAIAVQAGGSWLFSKESQEKSISVKVFVLALPLLMLMPESLFSRHDTTLLSSWQERMYKMQQLTPSVLSSDTILFVPRSGAEPSWAGELDGMLISQDLGLPTINGYSGSLPPGYPDLGVSARARFEAYAKLKQQPEGWIDGQLGRVTKLKINMSWLKMNEVTTLRSQPIVTNSEKINNQIFLVDGWALPEPWGTWTLGHDAQLLVPLPKGDNLNELELSIQPFINTLHPTLLVRYSVNNGPLLYRSWNIDQPQSAFKIPITKKDVTLGYLNIQFHIENPQSPKQLGQGEDMRMLGFGLKSMTFN